MVSPVRNNLENTEGYLLRKSPVVCPECSSIFATSCLVELPEVTELDIIEADLHRVLSDPVFRAALIAVCPDCEYAGWAARFGPSIISPHLLPSEADLEYSKKFAMAVKCARKKGENSLDIAFIALNGLWCQREAGQASELWLELAAFEQDKGLKEEILPPDAGLDHLVMAELWRQLRQFERAAEELDLAARDEFIPGELIAHQKMLCRSLDAAPTVLPPQIIRRVFPEAAEATRRLLAKREQENIAQEKLLKAASAKMQPGMRFSGTLNGDEEEALRHPSFSNAPPDRRPALTTEPQQPPVSKAPTAIPEALNSAVQEAVSRIPQAKLQQGQVSPETQAAPDQIKSLSQAEAGPSAFDPPQAPEIATTPGSRSNQSPAKHAAAPLPKAATPSHTMPGSPPAQMSETPASAPPRDKAERAPRPEGSPSIAQGPGYCLSLVTANTVISLPPKAKAIDPPQNVPDPPASGPAHTPLPPAAQASRASQNRERATTQHHHYFQAASAPDDSACDLEMSRSPASDSGSQAPSKAPSAGGSLEIPELKLTDDKPRTAATQPAAQSSPDYSDAVAQVESFLNLTRQSTYRNWIRGYRTN